MKNRRLNAHTCFRHLYCLHFNVDYTSLPLGTKALHAFIVKACHEDLTRPVKMHGWTATDIAKMLEGDNDKHVWPQQLLSKKGKGQTKVSVDWIELADEFVKFLGDEMLKSSQLEEVMKHIRLGQLCVLALWWA